MKPIDKGKIRPIYKSPPQLIKKTEAKKPPLKKQSSTTSIPQGRNKDIREQLRGETKVEYNPLPKSISATSTRFSSSKDLNKATQNKAVKQTKIQGEKTNPTLIIPNRPSQKNSFIQGAVTPREYPSQKILVQERIIGKPKERVMGQERIIQERVIQERVIQERVIQERGIQERMQQRAQQRNQLKVNQRGTPKQPVFSKIIQPQYHSHIQYHSQMQYQSHPQSQSQLQLPSNSQYPQSNSQYPQSNSQYHQSNSQYPQSNSQYPQSNSQYPQSNSQYLQSQCPQSNSQYPQLQVQSNRLRQQIKKSLANVIKVYYPQKKQSLETTKTNIPYELSRLDFDFIQPIGEGGYGNVWKVMHFKTKRFYAMKQMSKALVVMKKSVDNILNQRKILENIKSAFIANMVCAFNDRDNVYLVMDLLTGGDLRSKMSYSTKFNEIQTKFLVCCIIVAIQAIHKHRIFHRDLKPENLVFDEKGYLRVTDFGIARSQNSKQLLDASGTPGYMAPQVLCKQIHAYEVDFYAIGVITHEMMTGKVQLNLIQRPYPGNNRIDIRNAILSKQHSIKKQEIPPGWSQESADFVNRLLMRQPSIRLGTKGIAEVKQHPWFASIQWSDIENKRIKSPFPIKKTCYEMSDRHDEYQESLMQYKLLQRSENMMDAFSQYYFPLKQ